MVTVVPNFLPESRFHGVVEQAIRIKGQRVHIAGHKRGSTISYETLKHNANGIAALYASADLHDCLSSIVGLPVHPTPPHDQSSCSILIYDRAGDRIGWHFDHNFYNGRHFTALLPLINERMGTTRLSSSELVVDISGELQTVPTAPNNLVVFEGAHVRHQVTPLGPNERRWILSMTFCSDSTTTRMKDFARRIKDVAYFGVRALWM